MALALTFVPAPSVAYDTLQFISHEAPFGHQLRGMHYFGATAITDTCFSLLFLKRANLAKDLSSKLEFLTQTKKP